MRYSAEFTQLVVHGYNRSTLSLRGLLTFFKLRHPCSVFVVKGWVVKVILFDFVTNLIEQKQPFIRPSVEGHFTVWPVDL